MTLTFSEPVIVHDAAYGRNNAAVITKVLVHP